MNDSNDPKSLPPDDFSATVPHIPKPRQNPPSYNEPASTNDWEKTNYNYVPPKEAKEDWNKTFYNTPSTPAPQNFPPPANYGTPAPPQQPSSSENADWQLTQQNIRIPSQNPAPPVPPASHQPPPPQDTMYGATRPLIDIPDDIRRQYQITPPPTPTAQAAQKQEEEKEKKGGIPAWIWALGALFLLVFFGLVFAVLYNLLKPSEGFIVVIKNVLPGSDIRVDNVSWNIRSEDGSYRLLGLKAGETKKIEIIKQGVSCKPIEVNGIDGETKEFVADCIEAKAAQKPVVNEGCDPTKFSSKDIQKSHDCAYEKLRSLQPDFTVQQLLEAMNLYIINFDSGKFNVKPDDAKFLQEAAGYMKKLPPNVEIEVGGHTDNKGTANQALSNNRADAVKQALIAAGVNKDILLTRGYAETKPKDTNDTEDGRFRNRRIEYSAIIR